ncbi:hypothetical protein BC830DRAFT_1095137 [Chytriomyces sp. MP71]|nr:hypothetical protein BC830DRAFT_1095137 [Chytriomyces sp. MP71]
MNRSPVASLALPAQGLGRQCLPADQTPCQDPLVCVVPPGSEQGALGSCQGQPIRVPPPPMVNLQSQSQLKQDLGSSGEPFADTGYGLGLGQPCSSAGCQSGLTCVAPPNAPSAGICQYDGLGNDCCVSGTDPNTPPCPGASVCAPGTPGSDTGYCVPPFEDQFCFLGTYYACQMGFKCVSTGTMAFAGSPGVCQAAQASCLGDTCPVADPEACEVGLQCVGSVISDSSEGTCLVATVNGLSHISRASNQIPFPATATGPPTSSDSGPSTGVTATGSPTIIATTSSSTDFLSTNGYVQTVTSGVSTSIVASIAINSATTATKLQDGALTASYSTSSLRSDASSNVAVSAALGATLSLVLLF